MGFAYHPQSPYVCVCDWGIRYRCLAYCSVRELVPQDDSSWEEAPNPDHEHHLPTELLPKKYRLVEPTPSDRSKPDNAGGLPEPAGNPLLLNATLCFYSI